MFWAPLRASTIRRRNPLWVLVLALLVVSTQLGSALHAISHAGTDVARTSPGLSIDSEDSCALCALYAGGSNVLSGDAAAVPALPACMGAAPVATASFATSASHHYQSRAPPPLLAA